MRNLIESVYRRILREATGVPEQEELKEILDAGFEEAFSVAKEIRNGEPFKAAWYEGGGKLLPGDTKEEKSRLKKWGNAASKMIWQKYGNEGGYLIDYGITGVFRDVGYSDRLADQLINAPSSSPEKIKKTIEVFKRAQNVVRDYSELTKYSSLSDDEAIDLAAEAPPGSRLGRIAFADERTDVPKEPDTKEEKALYRALYNMITNNAPLSDKNLEIVTQILNSSPPIYSKMFSRPSGDISRGISMDSDWIKKVLGLSPTDDLPEEGEEDVSFSYKDAKRKNKSGILVTSWTYDENVAKEFAIESYVLGSSKGEYGIVLTASSSDNPKSFLDCSGFYELGELSQYEDQSEVLGFGPIFVKRISWFKKNSN